jgi:transglutaminase-like putative cysteine protease
VKRSQFRWWDAAAAAGLLVIVFLTATGLELTYWTYDLNRVTAVAVLSLISGMLIGISKFSRRASRVLMIFYGVAILLFQLVFSLSAQPLWLDRLAAFGNRALNAFRQLTDNRPLEDGVLFLSSAAMLFSWAALAMGFRSMRTGRPGAGLAFFALLFYTIQFFLPQDSRRYVLILVYSLVLGLLVARLVYVRQRDARDHQSIKEDASLSATTLRVSGIFIVGTILLAFGAPLLIRAIHPPDEDTARFEMGYTTSWQALRNFLFPLRQPGTFGTGDFAEIQGLGTRRTSSTEAIFSVAVPPEEFGNSTTYYWAGRTYATYQNGYWQSEGMLAQSGDFSQGIDAPIVDNDLVYDFTYAVSSNLIFHPQLTSAINEPATLQYYLAFGDARDLLVISDPNIVRSGAEIQVAGAFIHPAQDKLRAAGEDYPDWVSAHYLQIPADLSPKIVELAREATRGADNPFDAAQRLTDFLRNAYRYQSAVKIPRDAEPLEWFLFNGKAGFCNYYASAETVMLRSLGIPARFVAGYAGGRRSADGSQYTLLARDSHAWVEVYYPGIGWVIFEPTPLLPSVTFAESSPAVAEDEIDPHERFALNNPQEQGELEEFKQLQEKYEEASAAQVPDEEDRNNAWIWWLFPLGLFLVGLGGWWYFFHIPQGILTSRWISEEDSDQKQMPAWLRGWARRSGGSPLEKMYARIRQIAPIVGAAPGKGETPREFLNRFYALIDYPTQAGEEFLDAYQQTVFGREKLKPDRATLKHLTALYHAMLWAVIRKKWGDFKKAVRFRLKLLRVR